MALEKDPALTAALKVLLRRFGEHAIVVDHWESDPLAIGIARRDDHGRLAYFSVRPTTSPPSFFVALENPPAVGDEMPYIDAGSQNDLTLDEAAVNIARHLGIS